jgi:hypothetical protein
MKTKHKLPIVQSSEQRALDPFWFEESCLHKYGKRLTMIGFSGHNEKEFKQKEAY